MKRLLIFLLFAASTTFAAPPKLQLAKLYKPEINLKDYWVSEKYDGVRAYWNGEQLISRQGNTINTPQWFIKPLPAIPLDGELWLGRGKFDQLSGIVRQKNPLDSNWKSIKYMVFDLPDSRNTFDHRLQQLKTIITKINAPHIKWVKQVKIPSHNNLTQKLNEIVSLKGEGLMLHLGSSLYSHTRSNDLLKLKKHMDAEAIVIKHFSGNGKFKNMLGSMLVEMPNKQRFKIGSGFSNKQRKHPPPVGSVITYKYFSLTNKGIPRFASFLRVRKKH